MSLAGKVAVVGRADMVGSKSDFKPEDPFLRRVYRFIQRHSLVHSGHLLLVGVSGGPDSLALLHVLFQLREALGIRLHVAHLDHSLRPESEADARYVSQVAERLGLPASIVRADVASYRRLHHLSLEQAAREVRYTTFARVAQKVGADAVAVGHTADDQVETVLMHWLRGAGLRGLKGMSPITNYLPPGGDSPLRVLRPLLGVSRRDTESYCRVKGFEPCMDASNRSPSYLRNRLRHELIPLLQSYNPGIRTAILRASRAAAAELAFLEGEVARHWGRVATRGEGSVELDARALLSLPPAIQSHLLLRAVECILGDTAQLGSTHLEAMQNSLGKPGRVQLTLPRGLRFTLQYGRATLARGESALPLPALSGEHRLLVPGVTILPGWRVHASLEGATTQAERPPPWTAALDLDIVGEELWVRQRRPGDRFQPLGMTQPKKLQDFMVDAKIPRPWRDCVPLVVSYQGIIWVAGWRIAEVAKITPSTRRVLRLQFERAP